MSLINRGNGKVVAGYAGGVSGPHSVLSFATGAHNRQEAEMHTGRRMEIMNYPVTFIDGSHEVAFDVSVSVDLPGNERDDRAARAEAHELLKARAERMAQIFNAGVDVLEARKHT